MEMPIPIRNFKEVDYPKVAKFVVERAVEFYQDDEQLHAYTKKKMKQKGYTVEDLKADDIDADFFFAGVLKQHQGIYDGAGDFYFLDTIDDPKSIIIMVVNEIIDDLEKYYGKSWSFLLEDESIVKHLRD